MLYRLEQEDGHFLVLHLKTEREVGYALLGEAIGPGGSTVDVCSTFNNAGQRLASVAGSTCVFPMRTAPIALAAHQKHHNYPDLKDASPNNGPDRIGRHLGAVLADTISAFARGLREATRQGLTAGTRDQFAASLADLASIWWVSLAGCFDAATGREEPYFKNLLPSGPRLSFSGAAQMYGMRELRQRYVDISDGERQKLLNWALQWLSDALSNELEKQKQDQATPASIQRITPLARAPRPPQPSSAHVGP